MSLRGVRKAAALAALAITYFLFAELGLYWATAAGAASPVFPAAGVAIAGLLLGGTGLWPAIVVGRLAAALIGESPMPIWANVVFAGGNALAALLGAVAFRKLAADPALLRLRDVLIFLVVAAGHTAVGATIGTAVLVARFGHNAATTGGVWLNWWAGDLSGVLLVAPALLAYLAGPPLVRSRPWWTHFTLSMVVAVAVTWTIFSDPAPPPLLRTFLLFPLLVWAALACGVRGAAAVMVPVGVIAVWGTTMGYGPIAQAAGVTAPLRFVLLEQFLAVAAITALILAVVADERRGEEALRESETLTRTIAENSTQGIAMMDARGYCTFANPAWLTMTGYTADEIGSKPLHDLVHHHYPDGRPYPKEECPIDRALPENSDVRAHRDLFFRKDGTTFPVSCAASPIFKAGRPVSTVIEIRDVTSEREAEAERNELLERERAARLEAEKASRLKDEFLSTLSHELRTPLNAIVGWAQLLEQQQQTSDNPAIARALQAIGRNAHLQMRLVEDLLDMSRILSGKLPLHFAAVDLREVAQAVVLSMTPAADAKKIRIEQHREDGGTFVWGDAGRLQQVVGNLLDNAVKFTPEGGTVSVSTRARGAHVEIIVTDTGRGIAPEFLPHAFERFRQADASATRLHGGLGIGLSIVKSVVELHDGSVRVESEGEGRGATFTVELPALTQDPVLT